jgi:hypothetical protein
MVSITHSLYKNIVIIVSLFSNISIIYICININLCALYTKFLYRNASKRDIQSANTAIRSKRSRNNSFRAHATSLLTVSIFHSL